MHVIGHLLEKGMISFEAINKIYESCSHLRELHFIIGLLA